jgi:uncharacterized membrane protein YwzB
MLSTQHHLEVRVPHWSLRKVRLQHYIALCKVSQLHTLLSNYIIIDADHELEQH